MKTILTFLLATVLASLAGETEPDVSCVTNGNRVVYTETFTRNASTNLVRKTYTRSSVTNLVRQNVYYRGDLALELWDQDPYGLTCSAHSIAGMKVGTHFTPDGIFDHVNIMTTNLVTLDHFTVANGLLCPSASADLRKGNEITEDVVILIKSVTNTPPYEFKARAVELIKKHRTE